MAITSKKINLEQLDKELGNKGLCADFNDSQKQIIIPAQDSDVTEIQLENAIKTHIAEPTQQEITELNREQGRAKLKELGFTDDDLKALGL